MGGDKCENMEDIQMLLGWLHGRWSNYYDHLELIIWNYIYLYKNGIENTLIMKLFY